jgi:hypothetical protein
MMAGTGVAVLRCRMVRKFHQVREHTTMLASASSLDRNRRASALCYGIDRRRSKGGS